MGDEVVAVCDLISECCFCMALCCDECEKNDNRRQQVYSDEATLITQPGRSSTFRDHESGQGEYPRRNAHYHAAQMTPPPPGFAPAGGSYPPPVGSYPPAYPPGAQACQPKPDAYPPAPAPEVYPPPNEMDPPPYEIAIQQPTAPIPPENGGHGKQAPHDNNKVKFNDDN